MLIQVPVQKGGKNMNDTYTDIYKKLTALQWFLKRYQMMNQDENNVFANKNEGQLRVISLLKIQTEIATNDLSYILGIKQQSLNELLNRLEKGGYVERKPSEKDKRVMIVHLTEKGFKLEQSKDDYEEVFSCLSEEEINTFSSYIDRILASLEQLVGNPIDEDVYGWMEKIQARMGREQFERVVEQNGFAGMPFAKRGGFDMFGFDRRGGFGPDMRGEMPKDMPGAERFSPDYNGPMPEGRKFPWQIKKEEENNKGDNEENK